MLTLALGKTSGRQCFAGDDNFSSAVSMASIMTLESPQLWYAQPLAPHLGKTGACRQLPQLLHTRW